MGKHAAHTGRTNCTAPYSCLQVSIYHTKHAVKLRNMDKREASPRIDEKSCEVKSTTSLNVD